MGAFLEPRYSPPRAYNTLRLGCLSQVFEVTSPAGPQISVLSQERPGTTHHPPWDLQGPSARPHL